MVTEKAPAKINLYLHVGPLRHDGLHDLASIFVFTEDGDVIYAQPAPDLTLCITGPFADGLASFDLSTNLVLRAAELLRQKFAITKGAALILEKNLPIAAGIGGGSADAAAALRALIKLWDINITPDELHALAFSLGADVPACLASHPVNVRGAGEMLTRAGALPPLWVALVNPRIAMSTGPIFSDFDKDDAARGAPDLTPLPGHNYSAFADALGTTTNDLEVYARRRAPVIGEVIGFLAGAPGALIARMSGSGATCFALFSSPEAARSVARKATAEGWWALASPLIVR